MGMRISPIELRRYGSYSERKILKGSPQKARLVIDLIRGRNVQEALAILRFTKKRATRADREGAAVGRRQCEGKKCGGGRRQFIVDRAVVDSGPTKCRRTGASRPDGPGLSRAAPLQAHHHYHQRQGHRERRVGGNLGSESSSLRFQAGINRTWRSRWFARKDYGALLHEDLHLKTMLKKKFAHAGISRIEVERAANKLTIIIFTSRPGIIVGKKGTEIEKLKKDLQTSDRTRRQSEDPGGQQAGTGFPAGLRGNRPAAGKANRLPTRHAACGGQHAAVRRQGNQGPRFGPSERR